jgi:hypothetical protein
MLFRAQTISSVQNKIRTTRNLLSTRFNTSLSTPYLESRLSLLNVELQTIKDGRNLS